ncbi:N-acetylaspartate synthetase, partial [Tachysurus ichikawai]
MCFVMTKSFMLICCTPFILMGARYYYSRKVILNYLDCALHTDMADIEAYYMKPTVLLECSGLIKYAEARTWLTAQAFIDRGRGKIAEAQFTAA